MQSIENRKHPNNPNPPKIPNPLRLRLKPRLFVLHPKIIHTDNVIVPDPFLKVHKPKRPKIQDITLHTRYPNKLTLADITKRW